MPEDELVSSLVASGGEEVLRGVDSLAHVDVGRAEVVDDFPEMVIAVCVEVVDDFPEMVIAVCDELGEKDLPGRVVVPVSEPDERPEVVRVMKVVAAVRCWSETQPALPTNCRLVELRSPVPPVRSTWLQVDASACPSQRLGS